MTPLDFVLLVGVMLTAETIDRESLVQVFRTVYYSFTHEEYLRFQEDVRSLMGRAT